MAGKDIDPEGQAGSSYPWGCWWGLLGFLAVLMLWYGFAFDYLPVRPFDAGRWQHARTRDKDIRLSMVDWLRASRRLDGLTRPQVVALLGPPDGGAYFTDWDLVYWLGPERGFLGGLDSEWLVIRIGSDGRVADYRLVTD